MRKIAEELSCDFCYHDIVGKQGDVQILRRQGLTFMIWWYRRKVGADRTKKTTPSQVNPATVYCSHLSDWKKWEKRLLESRKNVDFIEATMHKATLFFWTCKEAE